MNNSKPGWQTSEFWLTLLSQVALILTTIQSANPTASWAAIAGVIGSGIYAISRGLTKAGG